MTNTVCGRGLLWGALTALGLALALLIAACGTAPHGTSATSLLPAGTGPTPSPTARAAGGTATPVQSATVILHADADHYTATSEILVMIHNTTGQTIYAVAHFTDCSAISLERLDASGWQSVHSCMDAFPHPTVERVAPGADVAISLVPSTTGSDAGLGATSGWTPGTYRAVLVYTTSESSAVGQGTSVYSSTFTIG